MTHAFNSHPVLSLKVRSLATIPLEFREVEKLYDGSTMTMERDELVYRIRRLCASHERLRAELEGAEILLKDAGIYKPEK